MYIRLTCFLLFLISSSQASISNATIKADAAKIFRLNKVFLSSSPAAYHKVQSLVCEMFNNCCPSVKTRFNEYVGKSTPDGFIALLNACIGDQPSQSFIKKCPTISKLLLAVQDKDFHMYTTALLSVASKLEMSEIQVERQCSPDETYASYCDWTQRQQLESCERKVLTYVSQHNSKDEYTTYVQKVKRNLHLQISAVKSAFPTKKNRKPNCLQQSKSQKKSRNPYTNGCKYSSY